MKTALLAISRSAIGSLLFSSSHFAFSPLLPQPDPSFPINQDKLSSISEAFEVIALLRPHHQPHHHQHHQEEHRRRASARRSRRQPPLRDDAGPHIIFQNRRGTQQSPDRTRYSILGVEDPLLGARLPGLSHGRQASLSRGLRSLEEEVRSRKEWLLWNQILYSTASLNYSICYCR